MDEILDQLKESVQEGRLYKGKDCIYDVNETTLGKMNWSDKHANNDYNIGRYVFQNGVVVPEYYRLVRPDEIETGLWYIIMQKIDNGKDINDLEGNELKKAICLCKKELEKVLGLGICPSDTRLDMSYWKNSIFDGERTYLIDFEAWKPGTLNELDELYKKLESL